MWRLSGQLLEEENYNKLELHFECVEARGRRQHNPIGLRSFAKAHGFFFIHLHFNVVY